MRSYLSLTAGAVVAVMLKWRLPGGEEQRKYVVLGKATVKVDVR